VTLGEFDREARPSALHGPGHNSTTGVAGLTLVAASMAAPRWGCRSTPDPRPTSSPRPTATWWRASEHETRPFWGIRGGGGNFRVVTTSFDFVRCLVALEVLSGSQSFIPLDGARRAASIANFVAPPEEFGLRF